MPSNERDSVFTFVVPVLNRASLLPRCLESIEAQTYRPLHVIVVDNGSTDDSLEVARKWGEARSAEDFRVTVLSEPKPGACAARNAGLAAAEGDFIAFADSDDEVMPQLAEKAMEALKAGADIAYWKVECVPLEGKPYLMHYSRRRKLRNHIIHAVMRTQAYACRTEFMRGVRGWDESLPAWNDLELGTRLLLRNGRMKFIDLVLQRFHAQRDSITGTGFSQKAGTWEKALLKMEQDLAGNRKGLRLVTYRRAILAAHYLREGRRDLAEDLLASAIADKRISAPLLKLVYRYTALGGRGAYILI